MTWIDDLKLLDDALHGAAVGPTNIQRQQIAITGLELVATLLRKNTDYGGSAFQPPVLLPHSAADTGILVRMSDKIQRIRKLLTGAVPMVATESLIDTIRDLAGYCILWIAFQVLQKSNYDVETVPSTDHKGPPAGPKPDGILSGNGDDHSAETWRGVPVDPPRSH
jgi:hypothetical protein